MSAVDQLAPQVGIQQACHALGVPRASLYRARRQAGAGPRPVRPRPMPALALSSHERQKVLDVLHSERFVDAAPSQVYATLLDEGIYLCSERTMYRILHSEGEVRERRNQLRHPAYQKPELLATAPNQVWSWDITKLLGPAKWVHYHLYVILDVFSRYVVGWMLAERETATLAERLIAETLEKHQIGRGQLTLHADRGSSMTSKSVALLLADLGVSKTHSRPQTSNDNPFSEAQFKTLKYHPGFPERFDSIQHARAFCRDFFLWYNTEHRHGSLGLLTPEAVHFGKDREILSRRAEVLKNAFIQHPERFKGRLPKPKAPPQKVWINPPTPSNSHDEVP
jgi:putative transposase